MLKQNWRLLLKIKKIKTMIDFDIKECNSIKSIALKMSTNIKVIQDLPMEKC